jgi:hypothetical protein
MTRKKEDLKKSKFILKYGLLIAIILLIIDFSVLFFSRNYFGLPLFADFINITIAIGVALISFFCYYHIPKKFAKEKNFFLFLFIAFILRFLGEVSWAYFDLFVKSIPDFSIADVMWMLSNFTILAGLSYHLRKAEMVHKKLALVVFTLVLAIISILFIGAVYLIMLNIEPTARFAFLINESYVLFDLIILILAVTPLLFSIKHKNKFFNFYFFIALGFVAYVIYDLVFAQTFMEGTYFSGGRMEFLYFSAYFSMFCAFYFRYKLLEN